MFNSIFKTPTSEKKLILKTYKTNQIHPTYSINSPPPFLIPTPPPLFPFPPPPFPSPPLSLSPPFPLLSDPTFPHPLKPIPPKATNHPHPLYPIYSPYPKNQQHIQPHSNPFKISLQILPALPSPFPDPYIPTSNSKNSNPRSTRGRGFEIVGCRAAFCFFWGGWKDRRFGEYVERVFRCAFSSDQVSYFAGEEIWAGEVKCVLTCLARFEGQTLKRNTRNKQRIQLI